MTKIKILIAALSAFGMLTACGDGFKASVSANGDVLPDPVPATTNPSRNQEIYNSFIGEFSALNASSVLSMKSSMDGSADAAIEVQVSSTEQRGAAKRISRVDVTLQLACDHTVTIASTDSNLDSSLKSGNLVNLGVNSGYEVRLQCVEATCDEMVAAIKNSGAMVLVGLQRDIDDQFVSGQTTADIYEPMEVASHINADSSHYATPRTIANLNTKCLSDAERAIWTMPESAEPTPNSHPPVFTTNNSGSQAQTATSPVNPAGTSNEVDDDAILRQQRLLQQQNSNFDPLYFDPNSSGAL